MSFSEFDNLIVEEAEALALAMPTLIAEEDYRILEVANYTDYNIPTQRRIIQRLERPSARSVDLKEFMHGK